MNAKDIKRRSQELLKQLDKPLWEHRDLFNSVSHLIVDCRKAVADAQALAPPQDAQHYIAEMEKAKVKADQLQTRVRELTQELADTEAVVAEQRHTLEEADKACKEWQKTTASLKEALEWDGCIQQVLSIGRKVEVWTEHPQQIAMSEILCHLADWLDRVQRNEPCHAYKLSDGRQVLWAMTITKVIGFVTPDPSKLSKVKSRRELRKGLRKLKAEPTIIFGGIPEDSEDTQGL